MAKKKMTSTLKAHSRGKTSKLILECEQELIKSKKANVPKQKFTYELDISKGGGHIEFQREVDDYILIYHATKYQGQSSDWDYIGKCEIGTCGAEDRETADFRAKIIGRE